MNDQVAEVKARTDIVSIIGERIELKKAGRNYKAICPFHGEKTPSFMVSPELQIFKCFGCSEAGDVFAFLEKYEGMEFGEALKYLADRAGIKLQRTAFGQSSEKERIIEINTQALRFYNYLLLQHSVGGKALNYLTRDRGIKKETIEEFGLGFSPDSPDALKKFLVDKKKYSPRDLEAAGLGIVRGASVYDRFAGRIIFPLFDHRGNPIGFAGRILPWDKRETGKYINSPETPVYHKSNVLYGLNLTRGNIKKKRVAIVVEGELDAISSYQAGIKNVVAIKGSALTAEQVRLLSRFANRFILALDADVAGDTAARRGLMIAGNAGVEVKVAEITGFKDPDEAARGNIESYKKDLINAKVVWDYLIDSVFTRFKGETGAGKAKISKEIVPLIAEIGDRIVQSHYANVVARRLGVPLTAVTDEISKTARESEAPSFEVKQKPPEKEDKGRQELLEERFLTLVFQSDPSLLLSKEASDIVLLPLNVRLLEEYKKFSSTHKAFNASDFAQKLPGELFDGFAKMVLESDENLVDNPDELKKELDLVKKELKILIIKGSLLVTAAEMRRYEETGESKKLLKAQDKFNKLAKNLAEYEEGDKGGIIFGER
ncbi:MAG TPA: DNA primase [Patescibacteria group bacterium]|nr:DNA primase [Patescibacteria group bacterium]